MTIEQDIIQLIKSTFSSEHIGDDCAVLPASTQQLLVSHDLMVEDIHFLRDMPAYSLGWKIAAINISDIASMGGTPLYFSLGMSLPEYITLEYITEFISGLKACLDEYNIILTGGDLTAGSVLSLAGHITGSVHQSNNIALRKNARPKDIILVSGNIGSSGAGLYNILNNISNNKYSDFKQAHYEPVAQVNIAQELISQGCTCMMDLSDGLLNSLKQISKQSQVQLNININNIPQHKLLTNWARENNININKHLLESGEDYQLIATVNPDIQYNSQYWTAIGTVSELTNNNYIQVFQGNKLLDINNYSEYQHFKNSSN